MRQRIHDTIFLSLTLCIAFMLPVWGRIIPPLIVLLVVNWLADGRTWTNVFGLFRRHRRSSVLLFGSLYLLYWAGMLYTSDATNGFFDLEVKLSLLLFPVVFSLTAYPVGTTVFMRKISLWFVAGCLAGAFSLLIRAGYRWRYEGVADAFYYTNLSWHFHASYVAMYYNLAIALIMKQLLDKVTRRSWWWFAGVILSLLLLAAMVFLLASKAGIVSLGLVMMAVLLYTALRLRNFRVVSAIAGASLLMGVIGFTLAPGAMQRMTAAGRTVSTPAIAGRAVSESSADRLVAWKTALEIFGEHLLTGVGTGDVRQELTTAYAAHHDVSAFEQKLNAHNQYLQTAVALGLPGLLLLLALLIAPAWLAVKHRQDLYLLFLLLFGFNILVESMFEVQAGVVFYAFFNTLFFLGIKNGDPFARTPA